jgi:hypothetical protein
LEASQRAFSDFASTGNSLAAGGLYRATLGAQQATFKVDAKAEGSAGPVIGRLLRLHRDN